MRLKMSVLVAAAFLGACSDQQLLSPRDKGPEVPATALQAFDCTGTTAGTLRCAPVAGSAGDAAGVVIGGQGTYLQLTSSNVSYDSQAGIFQFDVTVQNRLNEAIGTPDGTVADPEGIQVFFASGPSATDGQGTITVLDVDGTDAFTGSNQPYYAYHEILEKDEVSQVKTWRLDVPSTVNAFSFRVYVETDTQYLLVINEVLANPAGNTAETNGDWVELYNAGTREVDLQGLVIADSAASGRRPFHPISSSIVVPSGGYVVLGQTTNTTDNLGVPVDYAWGASVALASSLDAFKVARVYGSDTLTIDRTQYSSASTSAVDGVSRELKNPALDNSNMDGSNWGSASVTSVYGSGGRGTPKAQNSAYTP